MKTNDIKENFAALMRDALRARYGRIPSAAVVAREFNLRAYGTSPISQESARRWLRGVSLPEEERLRVLVNWLNLNFNDALRQTRPAMQRPMPAVPARRSTDANGELDRRAGLDRRALFIGGAAEEVRASKTAHNGSAMTREDLDLYAAILKLDQKQKSAIIDLIKATSAPHAAEAGKPTTIKESLPYRPIATQTTEQGLNGESGT